MVDSYRNRLRASQNTNFLIAQDYPEAFTLAEAIALKARGSWHGLPNQYQRDLHSRNTMQIMGHTLEEPVKAVFLYAEPKGPTKVSGGTNTAYQIAKTCEISKIINIATPNGLAYVEQYLKDNELDYPYVDIDWLQILKSDDPRLEYLT